MNKKKRTILIIAIAAVIIITAGLFGYAKYAEDTKVEFFSIATQGDDYYLEIISASCSRPGGRNPEKHSEFTKKVSEIQSDYLGKYTSGEYVKPTNIHASIEVKDGQTIFTYYGTATLASGETTQ
ncbi:MAG: hypothetical protein GX051_08070, partial [Clostridiales bacterium]|nr:hypothetical protein [Clostridiales bacterium]